VITGKNISKKPKALLGAHFREEMKSVLVLLSGSKRCAKAQNFAAIVSIEFRS